MDVGVPRWRFVDQGLTTSGGCSDGGAAMPCNSSVESSLFGGQPNEERPYLHRLLSLVVRCLDVRIGELSLIRNVFAPHDNGVHRLPASRCLLSLHL